MDLRSKLSKGKLDRPGAEKVTGCSGLSCQGFGGILKICQQCLSGINAYLISRLFVLLLWALVVYQLRIKKVDIYNDDNA